MGPSTHGSRSATATGMRAKHGRQHPQVGIRIRVDRGVLPLLAALLVGCGSSTLNPTDGGAPRGDSGSQVATDARKDTSPSRTPDAGSHASKDGGGREGGKELPADAGRDARPTGADASDAAESVDASSETGTADSGGSSVNSAPTGPATPSSGWHVDFADDFNAPLGTGAGQDAFWYPSQPWNATPSNDCNGNNSYETEVYNSSQVNVSGGTLQLTAVYSEDRAPASGGYVQRNYVSGIVTSPTNVSGYTGFTWTPGDGSTWAFEIVCQWPVNTGELFDAWWSSTQSGWTDERDFFEGKTTHASIDSDWIYVTSPVTQSYYATTLGFDPSAAMHRYTYEVHSDQSWSTYIDGALQTWVGSNGIAPVESSDDVPMMLIINYALADTTFTTGERTFLVDSVAVYQDQAHAQQSTQGGGIAPGTRVGP